MEYNEGLFLFAWFLAGFINGIAGLGAAMVAVPIAVSFMPPAMLTPVSCIVSVVISGYMAWTFRQGCIWPSMKNLLLGSVPGVMVGVVLLVIIPVSLMQLIIGSVVVLFAAWQCLRALPTVQKQETFFSSSFAGFCSSLLHASTSFGGPPLAVYALHVGWTPSQTLGTMNVFFVISCIATCMAQIFAGLYTVEVLTWSAMGIPAAVLGLVCAMPVVKRFDAATFRRVFLLVIACGGLSCIWRGLS